AEFLGAFREGQVPVIDKELISPVIVCYLSGVADVDIRPAITVDVRYTYAGGPGPTSAYPGFFSDIPECKISFIQIELIICLICNHIDIKQAVVVKVTKAYSGAGIEICVGIYIECVCGRKRIGKIYIG